MTRSAHVGYYLIDRGRPQLEREIGLPGIVEIPHQSRGA
jgi:hypothetical protein